jgi:predicted TIM-barrel fold metal-dependent hydrolase
MHVLEPRELWVERLPAVYRDRVTFPVERRFSMIPNAGAAKIRGLPIDEERFVDVARQKFSPASYIEAFDVEGVYASVLFPTLGLSLMGLETDDTAFTTAVARVYNDWVAEFVGEFPQRLFGVGMLDMRDPEAAAVEATRCVEELGLVGCFTRPNPVMGRQWYDPAYDVVWARLAALDTPVCFHEGGIVALPQVGPDRFPQHALWHVCNHPMEQQLAMVAMVLGGVLERHPALRVGFMEAGAGWLPYWMWRMDEQWERDAIEDGLELTMEPSKYVRRQAWVVADTDETTAGLALDALGGTNVCWGSDFPHPDSKYPTAYKTVSNLDVIVPYAEQVFWTNPQALYGPTLTQQLTT